MAERSVDYKVRAVDEASGVFAKVGRNFNAMNADLTSIKGNVGALAGIGKFAGGLLAVEKVASVMRSFASSFSEFADGKKTFTEAVAGTIDGLPIIGQLDEVAETVAKLAFGYKNAAEAAKELEERSKAAAQAAADAAKADDLNKLFSLLRPPISDADVPPEILRLRRNLIDATDSFRKNFGRFPGKAQEGADVTRMTGPKLDAFVAEKEIAARRQRLEDLETDLANKQAFRDARIRRAAGGDFGIGNVLRLAFSNARGAVGDFLIDFGDLAVKRMNEAMERQDKADREEADRRLRAATLPNAPAQFAAIEDGGGSGLAARIRQDTELHLPKNDEMLNEAKKQTEQGERLNENTKDVAEAMRELLRQLKLPSSLQFLVFSGK